MCPYYHICPKCLQDTCKICNESPLRVNLNYLILTYPQCVKNWQKFINLIHGVRRHTNWPKTVMNVSHFHNSLLGDVQMSDWSEVQWAMRDDWKSITMEFGEQSVIMTFTILMLALSVIALDTGWYWFDIISFQTKHIAYIKQNWVVLTNLLFRLHCVSKNITFFIFVITSSNIDRF